MEVNQLEKNRRRHVVGEIARNAQRAWGPRVIQLFPEAARLWTEKILANHVDVGWTRLCQVAGEVPVDFDGDHASSLCGQHRRDRAPARADFQKGLIDLRRDRADHLFRPGLFEKMLTEPLA